MGLLQLPQSQDHSKSQTSSQAVLSQNQQTAHLCTAASEAGAIVAVCSICSPLQRATCCPLSLPEGFIRISFNLQLLEMDNS